MRMGMGMRLTDQMLRNPPTVEEGGEALRGGGEELASIEVITQERMAALVDLPEPEAVAAEEVVDQLIGIKRAWYVRFILWVWGWLMKLRRKKA